MSGEVDELRARVERFEDRLADQGQQVARLDARVDGVTHSMQQISEQVTQSRAEMRANFETLGRRMEDQARRHEDQSRDLADSINRRRGRDDQQRQWVTWVIAALGVLGAVGYLSSADAALLDRRSMAEEARRDD